MDNARLGPHNEVLIFYIAQFPDFFFETCTPPETINHPINSVAFSPLFTTFGKNTTFLTQFEIECDV